MRVGISLNQHKERKLIPHSLRHTFVTLAQLVGIADVEIRALADLKNAAVMTKYSYVPKVIEFGEARRKIETSVNNGQEKKAANSLRRFEHSLPIGNGMLGYFQ